MEASTSKSKSFTQPRPISELLPGLSGILSKDAIHTLTVKKKPRPTMVQHTQTAEKVFKPLTMAEMRADILALKAPSPRRFAHAPSSNKKGWNSSVKLENKTISHTANGQMKNNPVRKVLNFQQPKPKTVANPRMTMANNTETPKFPKPEFRPKKSLHLQAKNSVRISGICNIPQTPVESIKPMRNRLTMANKENNSYQGNISRKILPPTSMLTNHKIVVPKIVPDTPHTVSNSSWKSGSDTSFLQKEKEIHDIEEKVKAIVEERTLENIAEVSPPVSTPFKEYRSVQEFFNNSSVIENSALYNDTIMCFGKPSISITNDKREESVILTLCELLNKATVTTAEKKENTELDNLLEVEKQAENHIKLIENGIQMLTNIRESQLSSLQHVRKLIEEKRNIKSSGNEMDMDKTLVEACTPKISDNNPEISPIISRPCSVIKKSPSYKIPRKSLCLRKKVVSKAVLDVSVVTPEKDIKGRALSEYMHMKEQMNFLTTPKVNRALHVPDTPAVTSHNLQKQLDKLYNGS